MHVYLKIKRLFDFCAAAFGLIVLAPFFCAAAVLIRLESKGPVFFKQRRVAKDGGLFDILKFRTMRSDTPPNVPTHLLQDPERYVTRTGRFLRRYSLDEIPQLINILRGEMSFVGPRPALWNQYDLIACRSAYSRRLLPGLTGLAQIKGRDELPLHKKAAYDNAYARGVQKELLFALALDMLIIWRTVRIALTGAGFRG